MTKYFCKIEEKKLGQNRWTLSVIGLITLEENESEQSEDEEED